MTNEIRTKFEEYQAQKLTKWKTLTDVQRTEEQQAFDAYVKALEDEGKVVICHCTKPVLKDNIDQWAKDKDYWTKPFKSGYTNAGKLKVGNIVCLVYKKWNDEPYKSAGTVATVIAHVTEVGDNNFKVENGTVSYYNAPAGGGGTGPQGPAGPKGDSATIRVGGVTTLPPGSPATVTNTGDEHNAVFNFGIPKGEKGSGGGGGSSSSITLPTDNIGTTVKGGYGCNLIDYRALSRNTKFGVNGQKLLTLGKKKLPSHSKYYAGEYTGVKANRRITANLSITKAPESGQTGYGEGKLIIQCNSKQYDKSSEHREIEVAGNAGTIRSENVDNIAFYGNYSIDIGTNTNPAHIEGIAQAYYGSVNPKNKLDRGFVFGNHNGYELKANYDTKTYPLGNEQPWFKHDEYKKGKIFDEVVYNLGHVRLKDCLVVRPSEDFAGTSIKKQDYLCVVIPNDADDNSVSTGHGDQLKGQMILTNNLSEVPYTHEGHIHENYPELPCILQYVTKIPLEIPQHDGTVKVENRSCWIIMCNVEHAIKHQDLLSKTEIIYPLKEQVKIKVPNSGFIVSLSNGDVVESWKYTQITSLGDGTYQFGASTLGYPDIKIQKSQIVSVSPKTP